MLLKLETFLNKISSFIGYIAMTAMVLMIMNVFYDSIARYFFHTGSIAMQEMEWHLFSVVILLGMVYTLKEDGHVRVDIIYDNLTYKRKAIVNMFGCIFFILPISFLVFYVSIPYAYEAYSLGERSGDPGGLPYRFLIKSLIPVAFFLLILSTIGMFIKNLNTYIRSIKSTESVDQEDNSNLNANLKSSSSKEGTK